MFKSLFALVRGKSHEAGQTIVDRNAMTILRQQIRDSAAAVASAKKAVAIATAQNKQEAEQHGKLVSRIADLEKRTTVAIEQGKDDLAREAAETIAILEAERDSSQQAQDSFTREINRLKQVVRHSEARLRELQRGHRIADATDKTQRMRQTHPASGVSALQDAEDSLTRLRDRQRQIDLTAEAMEEFAASDDPAGMIKKLAEAGCGKAQQTSADDVLARLTKKAKKRASKAA